jgi:hypothetical protein
MRLTGSPVSRRVRRARSSGWETAAPRRRAEQNLPGWPGMKRVADRRHRIGVANGCAPKGEANRIGQTADSGELPLRTRDACDGVGHPVQAMQPGRHEQPDRTTRQLLTLDAYSQNGLRVGSPIGRCQHALRRAIAASAQPHHPLEVAFPLAMRPGWGGSYIPYAPTSPASALLTGSSGEFEHSTHRWISAPFECRSVTGRRVRHRQSDRAGRS